MRIWDWIIVVGLVFIGISTWMVHPALMFGVVGAMFLVIGFGGNWNSKEKKRDS